MFGSGFKFTPASTNAGSSIFQGGSLFGGPSSTGGSLFGASTGGSLFNSTTPLFGGQNTLFKTPTSDSFTKRAEGEEGGDDEDDENFGKGDGSPPAYQTGENTGFGDAAKPLKLNIESKPPEKSPYNKIFNVQQSF